MSENRFDVHQALRVFAIVTQHGEKNAGFYTLDGMRASHAEDGYTVELTDDKVTLSIFFHNAYDVQFETDLDLDHFQRKLDEISQKDKQGTYTHKA